MFCAPFATPATLNNGSRVGDLLLKESSLDAGIHPSIHSVPQLFIEHALCTQHYTGRWGEAAQFVGPSIALGIFLHFLKITSWDSSCAVTF